MATTTTKSDAMAEHPFPLFDLPPELRLNIYEKAFEGNTISFDDNATHHCGRSPAPALLLTNKQVYEEAISIFWSCTTVIVPEYVSRSKGILETLFPRSRWPDIKEFVVIMPYVWEVDLDLDWLVRHRERRAAEAAVPGDLQSVGAGELVEKLRVECLSEEETDSEEGDEW